MLVRISFATPNYKLVLRDGICSRPNLVPTKEQLGEVDRLS